MAATLWLIALLAPPIAASWALFRRLPPALAGGGAIAAGYGIVLGTFSPALVLWALGRLGLGLRLWPTLLITVAAWVLFARPWSRHGRTPSIVEAPAPSDPTLPSDSSAPSTRARPAAADLIAVTLALLLLAVHGGLIVVEVMQRPLYPWDAWAQWATKAKVWAATATLTPFVPPEQWLAGSVAGAAAGAVPGTAAGAVAGAYTDAAPHYPALVPLLQTWLALGLGHWDERWVNLGWPMLWLGLVVAVYGQARNWPMRPALAAFAAYAVGSLPFVNVHAMLAGYADLPQAVVYALGAMALAAWSRNRSPLQLALGIGCAVLLPMIKQPGVLWLATLALVPLLTLAPVRGPRVLAAMAVVLVAVLAWLSQSTPVVFGYRLDMRFEPQLRPLLENMFLFGNWGLLFYVVAAAVALGWRAALAPSMRPLSAVVAAGAAALTVIFCFTSARLWVEDQSTLNRALLHWAPLAAFYAFVLLASLRPRARAFARAADPPDDARQ
jgi:hypothetical protein